MNGPIFEVEEEWDGKIKSPNAIGALYQWTSAMVFYACSLKRVKRNWDVCSIRHRHRRCIIIPSLTHQSPSDHCQLYNLIKIRSTKQERRAAAFCSPISFCPLVFRATCARCEDLRNVFCIHSSVTGAGDFSLDSRVSLNTDNESSLTTPTAHAQQLLLLRRLRSFTCFSLQRDLTEATLNRNRSAQSLCFHSHRRNVDVSHRPEENQNREVNCWDETENLFFSLSLLQLTVIARVWNC